jgi:hypothetical protein
MKTVNYFWYGLTSFVEGYVPFFSMITSIAAAFAISLVFPPITLIAFIAALLVGAGLAVNQVREARKKNQLMHELENLLADELQKKVNLKKQYQHNKEHFEHLVELINHANHSKLMLRKVHAYSEFLYEKIQHMHPDERDKFLKSPACKKINQILPILQTPHLPEHEFEKQTNQLEKLIEPMIGQVELPSFLQKHQLTIHHSQKKLTEHHHEKVKPNPLEQFQPTKRASFGVAIKTGLLTFAFASSVTALTASLILGLSPFALIAAMPIAAFTASLGLMVFALGLGLTAGFIYHKVIAPHRVHLMEASSKLPVIKQKNHELVSKLALEKILIEEQQQHLKEIEEDNLLLHAHVTQKAELLHKKLDPEYHRAHKLGVKTALHVANHKQIKDHETKPIPQAIPSDSELLTNMLNQMSSEDKQQLLKQLQDKPSPSVKERMRDGG